MKQDRFLLAILIGIALLVVLAVGIFFARQGTQEYQSEDTPEGVLHNYILAIHLEDYERAYGYLIEVEKKPTFLKFRQEMVANKENSIRGTTVKIDSSEERDTEAYISLTIMHGNGDPLGGRWEENASAALSKRDGSWKIMNMPYPYWGWDSYQSATFETVKPSP